MNVINNLRFHISLLVLLSGICQLAIANNMSKLTANVELCPTPQTLTESQPTLAEDSISKGGFKCDWLEPYTKLASLPKVGTEILDYIGAFRISTKHFGEFKMPTMNSSYGIFTYDPSRQSIFVIGHPEGNGIGEFKVPKLKKSNRVENLEIAIEAEQNFITIQDNKRVDTGINGFFRITGLARVDNSLMINYINWYDASGTETDTTAMVWDATNLATSPIYGPYQLQGAAHAAGWISPIPEQLHSLLGGTHITGTQPDASINSRLSLGPTAFSFDPRNQVIYGPSGEVSTTRLLDFPIDNFLYDDKIYINNSKRNAILNNEDGNNKLWTSKSGAAYGFIVPNTRTYMTLGKSGGHESGIGYKVVQDDGNLCAGACSKSAADNYAYFWLWDIVDFVKVRAGLIRPHELRPYKYGVLNLPLNLKSVSGGSFDPESNRLFLSTKAADTVSKYNRPPLFTVFNINVTNIAE